MKNAKLIVVPMTNRASGKGGIMRTQPLPPSNGALWHWAKRRLHLGAFLQQEEGLHFKPEKGQGSHLTYETPGRDGEVVVTVHRLKNGEPLFHYFSRDHKPRTFGQGDIETYLRNVRQWTAAQCREYLLPYYFGQKRLEAGPVQLQPKAVQVDWQAKYQQWTKGSRTPTYLAARGIPASVYEGPIFKNTWGVDRYRQVVVPHQGVTTRGDYLRYETVGLETAGLNGKRAFGQKGLWFANTPKDLRTIVLTESFLDAMSYATLKDDGHTLYMATGGPLAKNGSKALLVSPESPISH